MKTLSTLLLLVTLVALMTGCASSNLKAPCPNFGAMCHKHPMNGWGY